MSTIFILLSLVFVFGYFKEAVSSDKKNREEMDEKQAKRKQRKHTNIDVR